MGHRYVQPSTAPIRFASEINAVACAAVRLFPVWALVAEMKSLRPPHAFDRFPAFTPSSAFCSFTVRLFFKDPDNGSEFTVLIRLVIWFILETNYLLSLFQGI